MAKDEAGDSGDEFGHEDQTQEDGVLQRKRQRRVRFRQQHFYSASSIKFSKDPHLASD